MKLKVVIIQRIFSSYRKAVYDNLIEKVNLTILHGENNSGIKTIETKYSEKVNVISYGKNETKVYLCALKKLNKIHPDIVIYEFAIGILSLPLTVLWCKINNVKLILWSHGYNRKKGFNPGNSLSDKYRLWLLNMSDAVLLYGNTDKMVLSDYINPQKIFVAKNTLDTVKLLELYELLKNEGREQVKMRLGFNEKYNIIYIGRLLTEKLPDLLLRMIDYLSPEIVNNLKIHFVGEGPAKAELETIICSNPSFKNITKFHGKIYDDRVTGELLYSSDIMILPGEIGLSVNHALLFQCPVFTFEKNKSGPWHGPEEDYIINGVTGFKIKHQTVDHLAEIVNHYLSNVDLQLVMRNEIEIFVKNELLIENMVSGICKGIYYVSNKFHTNNNT